MKLDFMALRSEIVKKICATNDFLTDSALHDTKNQTIIFRKKGGNGDLRKNNA